MPQCAKCSASLGSVTMSSSSGAYEYTSAEVGVIVPSLTTSGYLLPVASKCRRAAPFPPVPSQCCAGRGAGGEGSQQAGGGKGAGTQPEAAKGATRSRRGAAAGGGRRTASGGKRTPQRNSLALAGKRRNGCRRRRARKGKGAGRRQQHAQEVESQAEGAGGRGRASHLATRADESGREVEPQVFGGAGLGAFPLRRGRGGRGARGAAVSNPKPSPRDTSGRVGTRGDPGRKEPPRRLPTSRPIARHNESPVAPLRGSWGSCARKAAARDFRHTWKRGAAPAKPRPPRACSCSRAPAKGMGKTTRVRRRIAACEPRDPLRATEIDAGAARARGAGRRSRGAPSRQAPPLRGERTSACDRAAI